MPTYDYVCGACGHVVEVIHGVHDHGPTECPDCHARAMRKAITSPTVLYKGSGWAKKDRGSSARTKAAAKAGSGSSDTGASPASAEKSDSSSGSDQGSGSGSGSGSDPSSSSSSSPPSAPNAQAAKSEGD